MQKRRNSIANALKLRLFCMKLSKWSRACDIFIMGIFIPEKTVFILKRCPVDVLFLLLIAYVAHLWLWGCVEVQTAQGKQCCCKLTHHILNSVGNIKVCIDGLVQDCSNSSANALELLQSCTKPSFVNIEMTQVVEILTHGWQEPVFI